MRIFFVAYFVVFSHFVQAQEIDYHQIDDYLKQVQERWDVQSFSVGIVYQDQLVFAKSYGHLKAGEREMPNKHTNYAIASNSKAFTSMLIAFLVQEGKIKWKDKVKKYLPYFELYNQVISDMVTIEDLLCHRVGLGTFSGDIMWYDSTLSTEDIVRRAKYIPKEYEFRDGFGYSNVMYIAAGDLIEKVTDKSWSENVAQRILKPLGMSRTVSQLSDLQSLGNSATPHATYDGKNIPIRWEDWSNVASTGGLISNVEDLSKWVRFNLKNGQWNGQSYLEEQNRNRIWTIHNPFIVDETVMDESEPDFSGYGLGFGLSQFKGHFKVSHTGGFGGMLSSITLLPDDGLGIIFLSNDTESPIRSVPNYIMDRFLDPDSTRDYAQEDLIKLRQYKAQDTRVAQLKASQIKGTKPSKTNDQYAQQFYSDLYGGYIFVKEANDGLHLYFEYQPDLSATLEHFHYDTFEIHWDQVQPWFDYGLVQFKMNPQNEIIGLEFNVPNDDFFFNELAPYIKP